MAAPREFDGSASGACFQWKLVKLVCERDRLLHSHSRCQARCIMRPLLESQATYNCSSRPFAASSLSCFSFRSRHRPARPSSEATAGLWRPLTILHGTPRQCVCNPLQPPKSPISFYAASFCAMALPAFCSATVANSFSRLFLPKFSEPRTQFIRPHRATTRRPTA